MNLNENKVFNIVISYIRKHNKRVYHPKTLTETLRCLDERATFFENIYGIEGIVWILEVIYFDSLEKNLSVNEVVMDTFVISDKNQQVEFIVDPTGINRLTKKEVYNIAVCYMNKHKIKHEPEILLETLSHLDERVIFYEGFFNIEGNAWILEVISPNPFAKNENATTTYVIQEKTKTVEILIDGNGFRMYH